MSAARVSLVVLALGGLACSSKDGDPTGASPQKKQGEAPPASPCSVNGMLFRDTAATDFERCGRAELPLAGDARECVEAAMREQRPFVLELASGALLGPMDTPALVGAPFAEGYALRSYMPEGRGRGTRTPVQLVMVKESLLELELMPRLDAALRCVEAPAIPSEFEGEWIPAKPAGRRRVNPQACVEWFDANAFAEKPWDSRFEAESVMKCDAS